MSKNDIRHSICQRDIEAVDRLCAPHQTPYGYVINRGPVETKTPHFGIWQDQVNKDYVLALIRWFDGTGIFARYHRKDLVIT